MKTDQSFTQDNKQKRTTLYCKKLLLFVVPSEIILPASPDERPCFPSEAAQTVVLYYCTRISTNETLCELFYLNYSNDDNNDDSSSYAFAVSCCYRYSPIVIAQRKILDKYICSIIIIIIIVIPTMMV